MREYMVRTDVAQPQGRPVDQRRYITRAFEEDTAADLANAVNQFLWTLPTLVTAYAPHVVSTQYYTHGSGNNFKHVCQVLFYVEGTSIPQNLPT